MVGLCHQQVVRCKPCREQAGKVNVEGDCIPEEKVLPLQGITRHGNDGKPHPGSRQRHYNCQYVGFPDAAAFGNHLIRFQCNIFRDQLYALRPDHRLAGKRGTDNDQKRDNTADCVKRNKCIPKSPDDLV